MVSDDLECETTPTLFIRLSEEGLKTTRQAFLLGGGHCPSGHPPSPFIDLGRPTQRPRRMSLRGIVLMARKERLGVVCGESYLLLLREPRRPPSSNRSHADILVSQVPSINRKASRGLPMVELAG